MPYWGRYWEYGSIENLLFDRTRPQAGELLVRAAERYLKSKGRTRLCAFSRKGGYLYYKDLHLAGEPLCWDGYRHVQEALVHQGYQFREPTSLWWLDTYLRPKEIRATLELEFSIRELAATPKQPSFHAGVGITGGWQITAFAEGQRAGACCFGPCLTGASAAPGAPVGGFGIETESSFRRRGVAMACLTRAMGVMWDHGIRRVILQTTDDNGAAISLYRKLGFVEDEKAHSHGFVKDMHAHA